MERVASPVGAEFQSSASKQFFCLGNSGRGAAILAGGYTGQRAQVSPAKRRPRRRELLAHCLVEFLRVQRTVLADRITTQDVEHGLRIVAQFSEALHNAARAALQV